MQPETLLLVLREVAELVRRPTNDFTWSSWRDADDALAELEGARASIEAGKAPSSLSVVFAPTGPLQELSLSSGWGDEFVALAERFDAALAAR
jgi:hypothetical protein